MAMRQTTPDLRDYRDKVTQYSANFQEAVGLVSQLGIDDVGKIAELKQTSAQLRDRLQLTNASDLMVLYLEMQSSEQEYLSTRKESAMKSMLNAIQQMESAINLSPKLDDINRADALKTLRTYESVAQEIVQLHQEILSKINKDVDGNSADVSKKLLNVANAEVARARLAIAVKIQAARVLLIGALMSALVVGIAVAKQFRSALQTLAIEQMKSERLLLNILPAPIAQRLKQEEHTIADYFAEATVLFADIVGFTELAAETSPIELVEILNEIFSEFDELVEKHGLEKIKTIGDAYMVVGGLPTPKPNHTEAIANMALDMQALITDYCAGTGKVLSIRIGIHTGPVIAGIIGTKKFIYDLWGDTVNTASRMESHGIPGCVQVTEATYQRLKSQYLFEERGMIKVKGKGPMNCYLLMEKIN
ncbi:MAG TPA: adenylate/guanylate cyclase domain-containing protein [Coleofasciculaceae cyanobacterium]